jgi:hypothetical protein
MMNWKGFGRKRSWPNRGASPAEGTEEKHEHAEDSGYPGRDSNRALLDYKSRSLP